MKKSVTLIIFLILCSCSMNKNDTDLIEFVPVIKDEFMAKYFPGWERIFIEFDLYGPKSYKINYGDMDSELTDQLVVLRYYLPIFIENYNETVKSDEIFQNYKKKVLAENTDRIVHIIEESENRMIFMFNLKENRSGIPENWIGKAIIKGNFLYVIMLSSNNIISEERKIHWTEIIENIEITDPLNVLINY